MNVQVETPEDLDIDDVEPPACAPGNPVARFVAARGHRHTIPGSFHHPVRVEWAIPLQDEPDQHS